MAEIAGPDGDTDALLERLKEVRRAVDGQPEETRREALEKALQESVADLPRQDADQTLAALRDGLIREARDRDRTLESLRERVMTLENENRTLQAEVDRVSVQTTPADGPAVLSGGDGLDRLRLAVRRVTENETLGSGSLDLPESELGFFRVIRALMNCAFKIADKRDEILNERGVGPQGVMGTVVLKEKKEELRRMLLNSMDNHEGSLEQLRKVLNQAAVFPHDLNHGIWVAVSRGTTVLLRKLDADPILEKHSPRFGGVKWESAFKELTTVQESLRNLASDDMWSEYFATPLKNHLERFVEQD